MATPASKAVMVSMVALWVSAISCWLRRMKSSSRPGWMRWRWRSKSAMPFCTSAICSAVAACTLMERSIVTPAKRFMPVV